MAIFSLTRARDFQRIFAVAHQDDPADCFLAVLFEHAATEGWAHLNRAEHADAHRRAIAAQGDDRIANVIELLDPADRPDQVLSVSLVDHPAADRLVRPRDRRVDLTQADAQRPELARVEIDLILRGAPPTLATSATPGTLASW